jgi:hypothetical protein
MKPTLQNIHRRKFFEKFAVGAIVAGFVNLSPLRFFVKKNEPTGMEKNITVTINPMAVKRSK